MTEFRDDPQTRGSIENASALDQIRAPRYSQAPSVAIGRPAKAIEVYGDVRAMFDSRPVNTYDGFLQAVFSVEPDGPPAPVVCDLVTSTPAGPYDYDDELPHNFAPSCAVTTFSAPGTGADNIVDFAVTAGVAGTLINLYIFYADTDTLVASAYGVDAGDLPSINYIVLLGETGDYVAVLTGVDSDDTDAITAEFTATPF